MSVRIANEARTPFFTPKTLAQYMAISERRVRTLLADREIESILVGGSRRILAEDVDAFVARERARKR